MKGSLIFPSLKSVLSNALETPEEKIATPQSFYNAVQEYYEMCNMQSREIETNKGIQFIEKPFTINGLCVNLGITKRKLNFLAKKPQYREIIEFCFLLSENYLEENMLNGKINSLGSIFALKNNFGWKENKQDHETNAITVNIVSERPEIKMADLVNDEETKKMLEESGLNFDLQEGE